MDNLDFKKIFGQNLKYYRNSCKYTQAKLSEIAELTNKYIIKKHQVNKIV